MFKVTRFQFGKFVLTDDMVANPVINDCPKIRIISYLSIWIDLLYGTLLVVWTDNSWPQLLWNPIIETPY